ncbi:MAG: Hsp33 family molecular chaperone HslO [Clostridia bacterium]|nr:Hsp33 family molecular chaperone HslO [Clostridia bacterium]MBP3651835.1 Hsp33 family molecular chaperone HslO [Clostridia bacterium]
MDMMNRDGIYHISLMGGQARAILIESTSMVQKAMDTHKLSRTATAALGRTLTATVMMGSMLKGDKESVSVQIKGGGPIGTVLAVAHGDLTVKGYVDNPAVDLPRMGKKLPVGAAVGKEGKMTVIKDMGMREPYIGQVNLVSGEIAEDFAMYFTASEQTPSLVSLGVLVDDEKVISAGGLIVQMLPGASEAAIASVEHSVPMFADISATIQEYHLEGAVNQLLLHLEPEVLEKRVPHYQCDCSRERIEGMLVTLGSEEIQDMIDTQHGAQVDCHFCLKRYKFTADDLKVLLAAATIREDK